MASPDYDIAVTIGMLISLISLTVLLHYEYLRVLSSAVEHMRMNPRAQMLTIIFGVFVLHLIEIAVYAAAYWIGDVVIEMGRLVGGGVGARDLFYFSAETYTGLGFGDILPTGDLRLMAGVETLNGLLLLGWTTSYTFITMQKYWESHAAA